MNRDVLGKGVSVSMSRDLPIPNASWQDCCKRAAQSCRLEDGRPPLVVGTGPTEGLVMVRVRAFSCNYRDRGFLALVGSGQLDSHVLGSEFAGDVVWAGRDVVVMRPGARVMGRYTYGQVRTADGLSGGVACNSTSTEYLILHPDQLIGFPSTFSYASAAGFALNSQTAASMVRRGKISPGERVVVFGASSAVGLCLIQVAAASGASVAAVTSRPFLEPLLRSLGASQVLGNHEIEELAMLGGGRVVTALGGTDCVFDPFCDVHFGLSAQLLSFEGRYVTCGVTGASPSRMATAQDYGAALVAMIQKNVTVITNCLGGQHDLECAIELCATGRLRVVVDSILAEDQAADFCNRSFLSETRVGKVIMQYQ